MDQAIESFELRTGMLMTTTPIAGAIDQTNPRDRFQRFATEWKEESHYMSNVAQMAMLCPYQKIIGMGKEALPLILNELQREPDQWFWALEAITDQDPVPPEAAGKVRLMAQAWIEWGKKNGIIGL